MAHPIPPTQSHASTQLHNFEIPKNQFKSHFIFMSLKIEPNRLKLKIEMTKIYGLRNITSILYLFPASTKYPNHKMKNDGNTCMCVCVFFFQFKIRQN